LIVENGTMWNKRLFRLKNAHLWRGVLDTTLCDKICH